MQYIKIHVGPLSQRVHQKLLTVMLASGEGNWVPELIPGPPFLSLTTFWMSREPSGLSILIYSSEDSPAWGKVCFRRAFETSPCLYEAVLTSEAPLMSLSKEDDGTVGYGDLSGHSCQEKERAGSSPRVLEMFHVHRVVEQYVQGAHDYKELRRGEFILYVI